MKFVAFLKIARCEKSFVQKLYFFLKSGLTVRGFIVVSNP